MNKTKQTQIDLATRMLKGKVDVDEVVLMTKLPKEEVLALKEEVTPSNSDVEILKNLDTVDLNIGEILFDDLPAEDEELEGMR